MYKYEASFHVITLVQHSNLFKKSNKMAVHWSLMVIISLEIFIIQCEKIDDPTIKPPKDFSADKDAQALKQDFSNSANPNLDAVTKLWFSRTFSERSEIEKRFDSDSQTPLIAEFSSRFHGPLYDLFNCSLPSPEVLLANTLNAIFHKECKEPGGALEEILCGTEKFMKEKIEDYYDTHFDYTPLIWEIKDIKSSNYDTDNNEAYINALLDGCWAVVDTNFCQTIKPEDAVGVAQDLRKANGEKKFNEKLRAILGTYCEPDIKMIFVKYRDGHKDDGINNSVDGIYSYGPTKRAFDYLVRYCEDTCEYYADELEKAINGNSVLYDDNKEKAKKQGKLEINTNKINRIILTRSEQDLGCILKKFQDKYKQPFTKSLRDTNKEEDLYYKSIGYLCGES